MKRRLYKSGTRFCFWRWTLVDSEYIVRLHLLKTPWFAICLHWLMKPDPEPYLHDHPVSFLSLILRGSYRERRVKNAQGLHIKENKWFNWIRATPDDRHSIVWVAPKTLTLCLMGPTVRRWGYHNGEQWMHWKHYNEFKRAGIQPW